MSYIVSMGQTKSITIRVTQKTRAKLEAMAKAADRSLSWVIRAIIDEAMRRSS